MKKDKYGLTKTQKNKAVKRFEQSINMDALRLFLDSNDLPKYQTLFGMMVDPAYRKYSFTTLLRKAQIPLQDIQTLYTDGMRHLGLMNMMNQLPQIMIDVAEDAKSSTQPCPRCDAHGFVPDGEGARDCPVCDGERYIKKIGDRHARDLVFESAKLTGQGNTIGIQTNINIGGDARMENMLKRTRSIVLDKVIEAEVTSPNGETET